MIMNKEDNRLLIYFFYDKDGIVDSYVDYMLADVTKHVNELIVVCNGALCDDGKKVFEKYTKNVIVRENKGFDVWAYRTALESVGLENLKNYSEVIMMNFTIMGPLHPFSEMFDVMDKKDVDFWGLTLFHGVPYDPFNKIKFGYLPTHIQSHFIAVRRDMLASEDFIEYWKNMPMITCYEEAIGWHEAIFTKTFEDLGYKWDAYIDTRDAEDSCYCPIIMQPMELVRDRKCPIFKRRSFFHDYRDILEFTTGEPAIELFNYIKNHTDYDADMILENIIRLENQADFKKNLHFNYILPCHVDEHAEIDISKKKVALVIHQYFEDLIDYCYQYALSMPDTTDIYITTDKAEKKEKIEQAFKKGPWNKVEVIQIENRGRDVSALLVATKDFIFQYDYVCFAHDKKVTQLDMSIKGESFSYKCFENLLKSKLFVKNVINAFEENKRLGMLVPPPPNFAEYYPTIGKNDWGDNFDCTVEVAKKVGIHVKFDKKKEPIAPLGTMFWFRPAALKGLYDYDWHYEDFPKEPNKTDGTVLHAIERLYPFAVQSQGYYPAWLMNAEYASVEVDNLYFMLRELNIATFDIFGPNKQIEVINRMNRMKEIFLDRTQKVGKLFLRTEKDYNEDDSETIILEENNDYYAYDELEKYGPINEFRWDPGEMAGIEVRIPHIEIKLKSGKVFNRGIDDVQSNGIRMDDAIVFLGIDPQIHFSIPEKEIVESIHMIAYVQKSISNDKLEFIKSKVTGKGLLRKIKDKF